MDVGRIVALVLACTIASALLAGLAVAAFIGVTRWWDDITRHQPHE